MDFIFGNDNSRKTTGSKRTPSSSRKTARSKRTSSSSRKTPKSLSPRLDSLDEQIKKLETMLKSPKVSPKSLTPRFNKAEKQLDNLENMMKKVIMHKLHLYFFTIQNQ